MENKKRLVAIGIKRKGKKSWTLKSSYDKFGHTDTDSIWPNSSKDPEIPKFDKDLKQNALDSS